MLHRLGIPFACLAIMALASEGVMFFVGQPRLRVGMKREAVNRLIGPPLKPLPAGGIIGGVIFTAPEGYWPEPDWLGNRVIYQVSYDADGSVEEWKVLPMPRVRPPWLDRAMKGVGW